MFELSNLTEADTLTGSEYIPVLQNGVWCKAPLYKVLFMTTPTETASPTAFTATAISDVQINLAWAGVGNFILEKNRENSGAWVQIYSGATASYNDTVLYGDEHYYYRLSAIEAGKQYSFYVLADATTFGAP